MTSLRAIPVKKMFLSLLPLLLLAAAPARAAATITKTHFSITFAGSWDTSPYLPATDSSIYLMDTVTSAVVVGGIETETGAMTEEQWRAAWSQAYAHSLAMADSGTKTLGGKSFFWTEWQDTSAQDTGADVGHGRFYVVSQGNAMFFVWVAYNAGNASTVIPGIETALATLQFIGIASVRPVAHLRIDPATDVRDALGRAWRPVTYRLPQAALFVRPR